MAAKKKKVTKKTKTKSRSKPKGIKVYFIAEDTRAWLLDYLENSPGGQYPTVTINSAMAALRNAGSGHVS